MPCEGGTPALDGEAAQGLRAKLDPAWVLEVRDGHDALVRRYRFDGFLAAVGFVNRIAPVAEAEGHHPDLLVGWGRVEVVLWTHAAGGLTENDFILAARIDAGA